MTYFKRAAKPEHSISKKLREELENRGCVVIKTHGNEYVNNLPDFIICRPDGEVVFAEMKWTDRLSITYAELIAILDKGQLGFLMWIRRQTKCRILIIAGGPNGYAASRMPPKNLDKQVPWRTTQEMVDVILNLTP